MRVNKVFYYRAHKLDRKCMGRIDDSELNNNAGSEILVGLSCTIKANCTLVESGPVGGEP